MSERADAAMAAVLVVDGDRTRREDLGALLREDGYDVSLLASGSDAVTAARALLPEVVLLHEQLTEAHTLLAQLRAQLPDSPSLLLVARAFDEKAVAAGLTAGADDCVVAAHPVELRARVGAAVRGRRRRDNLPHPATAHAGGGDPLTGLASRATLEAAVNQRIERGEPFALLRCDVDHFEQVNQRYGHEVGDHVLRAVGGQLRRAARHGDLCARWGGEQFVVLATGADAETARRVAERHRLAIAILRFASPQYPDKVTISIGVGVYFAGCSSAALLERADAALERAKRAGRDRVVLAGTA
jgi:diguanylate cyclase (GGDEF)-like protein